MKAISLASIVATMTTVSLLLGGSVRSQNITGNPLCSAPKVWLRKMTINNTLDASGKMVANVAFENDRTVTGDGSYTWQVDVEQKTETCDGGTVSSRLVYTIFGDTPYGDGSRGEGSHGAVHRKHHRADYELFAGVGYYKFHPEAATWPRAREICSEEDAHLVIFNSEQESNVAVQLFARHASIGGVSSNDWAWVGLQEDPSAKGNPHTIFGETWAKTGFARWHPTQPSEKTLDDYMLYHRINGGYGDVHKAANWRVAFLCEQEI